MLRGNQIYIGGGVEWFGISGGKANFERVRGQKHVQRSLLFMTPGRVRIKDGENHISIGRSESNMLILDAMSVSRKHAELQKFAEGWMIRDLGAKNGTFISLPNGDLCIGREWVAIPLKRTIAIRFGTARLLFEFG